VRILFDECAPWPLSKLLKGHVCSSALKEGWRGTQNGELLQLAETKFDLFLTCDQAKGVLRGQLRLSQHGRLGQPPLPSVRLGGRKGRPTFVLKIE